MEAVFVLFLFSIPAAIVLLVPVFLRSREKMALLRLVSTTAESGQPIAADVVYALRGSRAPSSERDLRRGALLLAVGIALFLIGLTTFILIIVAGGGDDAAGFGSILAALGIFPACLGSAYLYLARADRNLVKD